MEEMGGIAGYRLFETVRLYAAEKLNEAGEADLYRERNRDWWEEFASSFTWEETFFAPRPEDVEPEWYNQRTLTEMQAGIRAALEWSDASGRLDRVVGLAARTFPFWGVLGNYEEGYRWLTKARPEDLDLTPEVRAAALSAASLLAAALNDPATVSLTPGSFDGLAYLATCAHLTGDHARALEVGNRYVDATSRRLFPWLTGAGEVGAIAALGGAGEMDRARDLLADRCDAVRYANTFGALEQLLVGGAALAFLAADYARCSRLLAWVRSRTFDAGGIIFSASGFALYRHYTALVRESVDKDDARRYRQEGRTMSEDEAIACALEGRVAS
jgi:hypothetical protein